MGIYSNLRDRLREIYTRNYTGVSMGRLVSSAESAARKVVNFGSMSLEYLIYPQPTIISNRDPNPDNTWPCHPDGLTGNDPSHPNHHPRYPRV